MSNNEDSNYVSVGTWMLILFCTFIPIIGVLMILFGAFVGQNESRKNYFRAILAWLFIVVGFAVVMGLLGTSPEIVKHIQSWTHKN